MYDYYMYAKIDGLCSVEKLHLGGQDWESLFDPKLGIIDKGLALGGCFARYIIVTKGGIFFAWLGKSNFSIGTLTIH